MKMKIFLICLVSLTIANCLNVPNIEVFVESLCPDCQDFIGGSFANLVKNPSYTSMAKITFYPYGNAKEKQIGQGKYEFTCQHGANECYGNVVEVCGVNKMSYEEGHQFMICMENSIRTFNKDINKALKNCVSDDLINQILECANGDEGNSLQHDVAQKTPATHKYVPWIVVDGVHDEKIEGAILDNLNEYLCGLEVNKSVPGCDKSLEMNTHFIKNIYKNYNSLTQRCPNTFLVEEMKFLE